MAHTEPNQSEESKVKRRVRAKSSAPPSAPATQDASDRQAVHDGAVNAWMDDPQEGTAIARPSPDMNGKSLQCSIVGPAVPSAFYPVGTDNFRYWTAAEALRRCAEFWLARTPALNWHSAPTLSVHLDDGLDFNAFYDRQNLVFFHGTASGKTVYSGESPDIVCHEMGHAILDAFKPELWNVASHEVAAFHESFGDMSAILSALQLPEVRKNVLEETGGRINQSTRTSRLAEQLGAAIRVQYPDAVEPDCLRNASNRFLYQSPLGLKSSAPASTLSAEPHSFSRVFTGAFLDALAGMLMVAAAKPAAPTENELKQVSEHMGDILIAGIRHAAVVSNFYAQVAAGMVIASAKVGSKYPRVMKAAFLKRDILSLQSATSVESLSAVAGMFGAAPGGGETSYQPAHIALEGAQFGLGARSLVCETPSQPRRIAASAAATEFGAAQAAGSEVAARGFVEELFKRGRVDLSGVVAEESRIDPVVGLKTHKLFPFDGAVELKRVLCDCGLCQH
jgi:hypothetical protein